MWLSRRLFIALPLVLAACGFAPVYAPQGAGARLHGNVAVTAPVTRDAYLLTQRLEERLGRSASGAFILDVDISVTQEGLAVDQKGNTTRYTLLGEARYSLTDTAVGTVATSGTVQNFTGYSATGTTVATLAAEKDAQKRLMIILADQIVTRLHSIPAP